MIGFEELSKSSGVISNDMILNWSIWTEVITSKVIAKNNFVKQILEK